MNAFETLRQANVARARRWHGDFHENQADTHDADPLFGVDLMTWTGADWANAAAGEMGEACNVVKKLRRADSGLRGANDPTPETLRAMLGDEIADTILYLDLLAAYYGIDLWQAIASKFNRVSEREGFPDRLAEGDPLRPRPLEDQ